jgi:hypothetical protein
VGVTVLPREVSEPGAIDRAFAALKRERPAGLIVLGDRMFGATRKRIVELTIADRLPTAFTHRWWVESGGLLSYGANFNVLYRRAATYVDKILRGAKPGDIPVKQPTRVELVINFKTPGPSGSGCRRPCSSALTRSSSDGAAHFRRSSAYVIGYTETRSPAAALFRLTASAECHAPAATVLRKRRPSAPHSPARARSSRGQVKNHSVSRRRSRQTLHGGAKTRV